MKKPMIETHSTPHAKTSMTRRLMELYRLMADRFGPRNWWPADAPFEVCVGAILTQNTTWKNTAAAIERLKQYDALDARALHEMPAAELAEIIRPAGYFNVKAKRLQSFVSYLIEGYNGDLAAFFALPTVELREELLSINGIGPETADSIILYAALKPIFVVDAYTKRVLSRHEFTDEKADYDTVQRLFHDNLAPDTALYNDFHAQFVAVGHHYCKPKPRCEECPLRPLLERD